MSRTRTKPVSSPSRGGVFRKAADPLTERFTQSISYDRALYRFDIAGSRAHARMLQKARLLTKAELQAILKGLDQIEEEIEAGRFVFRTRDEDIHMNIERALGERIGAPARKLHTARSRNDQIALDERLWIRAETGGVLGELSGLQRALLLLAKGHAKDPMPGYTHLQRAQPVSCGHYLLAFVEMFERDRDRFSAARRGAEVLPLGACALGGTTLPILRRMVMRELKFKGLTRNSMDTVADRDFLLDFAYAMSVCAVHISRLAEDFILFSTPEFGLLTLDEAFCTGSSLMPQKRNPDVLELLRGKASRPIACLQQLLVLLKGLPLTYNRDLQEDKELLFNTTSSFRDGLQILQALLKNVSFNRERMARVCEEGFMDSTALAEYLVRQGVPFREAHHAVGGLAREALAKGVRLDGLDEADLVKAHPKLNLSARSVLGARGVLAAYRSEGSPRPSLVLSQIRTWNRRLKGRRD